MAKVAKKKTAKTAAKKPATRKVAAKKSRKTATKSVKKPAKKKVAPKKAVARKAPAKKVVAKKVARKAVKKTVKKTIKKPVARKAVKKAAAKKPARRKITAKKPVIRTASSLKTPAQTTAFFEQTMSNATHKTMEKTMTQSTQQFEKLTQDANAFSRDGVEAFIKSGTIFAKGFEDLMKATASLAKNNAEKQAQLMKAAMSAKTVNEWAEIQNKMTQANFDEFMSSATKISEMGVKLLTEASEPINEQMTKSMQKVSKAAA